MAEENQTTTTKYPVHPQTDAELEKRFTYHAPKGDQVMRYQLVRTWAKEFALVICKHVPPGREQSLALTHIEEAAMWANAGIARNE